jgi:transposase InsO family protein
MAVERSSTSTRPSTRPVNGSCNNFAKHFRQPPRTNTLIFDRDTKFGTEVRQFLDSSGICAIRTSYRSPWQNGIAERWVRSFRSELLDHVIVFHEGHLKRLARDYLGYYHADGTHDGLDKDTPEGRPKTVRDSGERLSSLPRLGGLHHRYSWAKAA